MENTLELPTIMVNFKTYAQASGEQARTLAKLAKEVATQTNKSIAICPQAPDLYFAAQQDIPVLAQHFNSEEPGSHTGKISIKSLKENGCTGSLLNHSENRIPPEEITKLIHQLREAKLISVVCVQDVEEAEALAKLKPDIIAIEPPALIGGDVSVTSADPAIVADAVAAVHKVDKEIAVLCGAGVKTSEDVAKAIELGAAGVLVASGVTKAKDQKEALLELSLGI